MPKTIDSYRAFIAIELPADTRRQVKKHIENLRAALPDVRASWTREDNLHLTLKFLGDTPIEKIDSLSRALQAAANRVARFEMIIKGPGAFPSSGKPNVLWIGIEDSSGNLHKLQEALEDSCAEAGFPRDARAFHPHLTIARLRHPHGARRLAELHKKTDFDPMTVRVEDVCLIRSELSSQGSRYTVIARHEFQAKSTPKLKRLERGR